MKKILILGILTFFYACSSSPQQPKNKLSQNQMAEIIADLAIYNQSYLIDFKSDLENADRFVLKKHNISSEDFKENYTFYTFTPSSLDEIYDKAKKIILEKDPKLKEKLTENNKKINK